MPDYTSNSDADAKLASRSYWVVVHAKSGKVCWTGKLESVTGDFGNQGDGLHWNFTVRNTQNEADDDPGQGDETVTVTVVNPDNGPSNPADVVTNVVGVN